MTTLALYGNRESGHTYKVRLMLAVTGLHYDYHEVDLKVPRAERAEPFRSLSKFGEVPVLVHDGQPYVQSDAILCHLAEHLQAFGGESPLRMAHAREWLFWEANRIGFSLPNVRFARKFAPNTPAAVQEWMRARMDTDLARLDAELADGRAFILGEQPSIADFALCGYSFWPEQAEVTMPPHVQAWLDRISSLPGWRHPYEM
jgi:glutathione S-transferase